MFMKKIILLTLISSMLVITGCSTTARFKLPQGTKIVVDNVPLSTIEAEEYKRSPYFWNVAAGIPYRLEKDGKIVKEGNLKSRFRVASIFWPPGALIYWPMGFDGPYDLTEENSKVRPNDKK
jgi:hypothetical protein